MTLRRPLTLAISTLLNARPDDAVVLLALQRTIPVGPGARLGPFFVRTLPRLMYIAHFLALSVDDFLGFQSATVAEMSLCLTLCFCVAFGIPLSWKKLQFGCSIRWIGRDLDFDIGCVSIPSEKLEKLADFISTAGLARVACVIMGGLLVVVVEPSMPYSRLIIITVVCR